MLKQTLPKHDEHPTHEERARRPPFSIGALATATFSDPADYLQHFRKTPGLVFDDIFDSALLDQLTERAARTSFEEDVVENIGTREIEAPQRVGRALSMLLSRPALLNWLSAATGVGPLRAVSGRLVQTRANNRDALGWHADNVDPTWQLGVVINLSQTAFEGGLFELRYTHSEAPILSFQHRRPGTMVVFAVRSDLQHRVTPVIAGGPRRVYAGWFLTEPEHPNHGLIKQR